MSLSNNVNVVIVVWFNHNDYPQVLVSQLKPRPEPLDAEDPLQGWYCPNNCTLL